jgi:hypothetical protein
VGGIQGLLAENLELINELNTWRLQCGQPGREITPASDAILGLLNLDKEIFGTFPGGFGDNAQVGPLIEAQDEDAGRQVLEIQESTKPPLSQETRETISQPQVGNIHNQEFTLLPSSVKQLPHNTTISMVPQDNVTSQHHDNFPTTLVHNTEGLDENLLLFLDNEFGSLLPGGAGPVASLDFRDLNMLPDEYDFAPLHQNDFYMASTADNRNFGYMPRDSTG